MAIRSVTGTTSQYRRPVTNEHGHAAQHGGRTRRVLWITLFLNVTLLVIEVVAGLMFSSLALLADGAHQATDVVALGIALVAQSLMRKPGSRRHTYGLLRAEAVGAQVNALLLIGASVWILVEAAQRIGHPEAVDGVGVLAVATAAFAVNAGSAALLARGRGRDLNLRAVWLHMASDAAGSVAAAGAGVAVIAFSAESADPIASIVIAALVVGSAWRLLRDTTNVLLEGAPRDLDLAAVEAALVGAPHVEAVHHLHVWELGTDLPALSVHVVLDGEPSLHDAQAQGNRLKAMLADRFGIEHATLELECHDCESATSGLHASRGSAG
jgi:cobalt-zinc-cadmium efflux system protein